MLPALVVPLVGVWGRARKARWVALVLALAFAAGFTVQGWAVLDPLAAFWSCPVERLFSRKPWTTACGLGLGLAGGLILVRWLGEEVSTNKT